MKYSHGSTRRVLVFNKFVVKFPKLFIFSWRSFNIFYGFRMNMREATIWNQIKDKERFAKVYYCAPFGIFLIMEKLNQSRNFNDKILNRIFDNSFDSQKIYGIKLKDNYIWYPDMYFGNFGFRGRKLVCLDYA